MNLPIRLRLTLWYSLLLAVALLVFSATVYLVMANALLGNLDTTLAQRLQHVAAQVHQEEGRLALPRGEERSDTPVVPTVVFTPSGSVAQGSLPVVIRRWLQKHQSTLGSGITFHTVGALRVATSSIRRGGRIIGSAVAWQSLEPVAAARHSLLAVILAAGPALLLVAILGGLTLARRALVPVAAVTHTASTISVTDLHRRVPVGEARDELSELAVTFNAMLDRLEAAVERERRFTADASHELRSPLAVIRAEATLALDRPRQPGEYRQALVTIDEEVTAMEDLVAALLALARIESSPPDMQPVTVTELVAEALGQCRQVRECPLITVSCAIPDDLVVRGAPSLLTRAIRNIVENAFKVSRTGDTIRIEAWRATDQIVLAIEDEGPGIAPEHQQRIFEPFYQVVPAHTPGESHGLGLAICRRMVEVHGGRVTVRSVPGQGARFEISLPAAREDARDGSEA